MAPAGLVISKTAIQAVVADGQLSGVLCLKISLPKDIEGHQGAVRWPLFSFTPPFLTSIPSIYPLPLSQDPHLKNEFKTAKRLLGLHTAHDYPPASRSRDVEIPYIDVSSTDGQISIVLKPKAKRRSNNNSNSRSSASSSILGSGGRNEWLIILNVTTKVNTTQNGVFSSTLPLPRCLDNVLRIQISASDEHENPDDREVNILTEPKLLPLPPPALSSSTPTTIFSKTSNSIANGLRTHEEGWEDGEDLSEEEPDHPAEESELKEGTGENWLEGRFQSTDSLRLEWSFSSSSAFSSSVPILQVSPIYDRHHPFIQISYESPVYPNCDILESILPDGWGWSELSITSSAGTLIGWNCVDGQWWDHHLSSRTSRLGGEDTSFEPEDSFSTIRGSKSSRPPMLDYSAHTPRSSASLMKQTMPEMKVEDFSFELSEDDTHHSPSPAPTPVPFNKANGEKKLVSPRMVALVSLVQPLAGRMFELHFDQSSSRIEEILSLKGTIVPLSKRTLVRACIPVSLPRVVYGESEEITSICPKATYGAESSSDAFSWSKSVPAHFSWSDANGSVFSPRAGEGSAEDVRVRVTSKFTTQLISIEMSASRRSEKGLFLPLESENIKISKANQGRRSTSCSILPVHEGTRIYFGRSGRESLRIVLELTNVPSNQVILPSFEDCQGKMIIDISESAWKNVKPAFNCNLQSISPSFYSFDLSSPSPPLLSFPTSASESTLSPVAKSRLLFSWNTLINLFVLWLLISMAQQVQRLRSEVAFISEEAKDLRMYFLLDKSPEGEKFHIQHRSQDTDPILSPVPRKQPPQPMISELSERDTHLEEAISSAPATVTHASKQHDVSTALGRVVFGRSGWDRFASHPTIQTLSKGLGWLWHTVVWLVIPP